MTNYKLPSQCYSDEREVLSQWYQIMCENLSPLISRRTIYLEIQLEFTFVSDRNGYPLIIF